MPESRLVYRHRWPVRVMHWINVICLFVLLGSGLQIFNAHPALYWGNRSDPGKAILTLRGGMDAQGNPRGTTHIGGHAFDTTGVLGASKVDGEWAARGFPAWATIPGPGWLAMGRRWHFFFAWLFVANGIAYVGWSLASRHLDPRPRAHARRLARHRPLDRGPRCASAMPHGDEALRYNVLQRIAYLVAIFVFGGGIVLMGIAMSPRMDAVLHWLVDAGGGRQSARTIHFFIATAFVAFILVHVFEVLVSGPLNQLRGMITGWYRDSQRATGDPP